MRIIKDQFSEASVYDIDIDFSDDHVKGVDHSDFFGFKMTFYHLNVFY